MSELRYIHLPVPTGGDSDVHATTESNPDISIEAESGIGSAPAGERGRYPSRAIPTPQAASDPRDVLAPMDRYDLHCHPRYSQPNAWSWGKVHKSMHNNMLAAWQRLKLRMRQGVRSQDN